MSKLDLPTLKLNKNWVPIEAVSARQAFSDISAGAVNFMKFDEGYPKVFTLDEWLELEPAEEDDYVVTSKMHELKRIVIPRVTICVNYKEYRAKAVPHTPENALKRYGGRDAVSGKPLSRKDYSSEHVIPRSKGGRNGWENEVPMHRDDNSRRGNRDYADAGMSEPTILPAPAPLLPINTLVNKHGWPEWEMFHIPAPRETT